MSTDTESHVLSAPVPGLKSFTQGQFFGVIALVIGTCQILVGIVVLDRLLTVVVTWGGWLFVTFGWNLVRNRSVIHNGWTDDGVHGWISLLVVTVTTAVVLVASGLVLVG